MLLQGVSGHHRPDHHARPDQPRLRRREVGDVRRRLGADGHRLGPRRGPRGRGGRDGDLQPAARGQHRRRPRRAALDRRRLRPRPVRDQRGRARWCRRRRTPRPTSSSARSSTTPSATRCGSPSSRPASTAARRCTRADDRALGTVAGPVGAGSRRRPQPPAAGRAARPRRAGAGRAARAGHGRPATPPRSPSTAEPHRRAGPRRSSPAPPRTVDFDDERRPRRPGLPEVVATRQQGRAGRSGPPHSASARRAWRVRLARQDAVRCVRSPSPTARPGSAPAVRRRSTSARTSTTTRTPSPSNRAPARRARSAAARWSAWTRCTAPTSPSSTAGAATAAELPTRLVTTAPASALAVLRRRLRAGAARRRRRRRGRRRPRRPARAGRRASCRAPSTAMRELGAGDGRRRRSARSVCGALLRGARADARRGRRGRSRRVADDVVGHAGARPRRPGCVAQLRGARRRRCAGCPAAPRESRRPLLLPPRRADRPVRRRRGRGARP